MLARVEHDPSLQWEEHPGAIDLPRLIDTQAEQVLRDGLDRNWQLGASEEREIALADPRTCWPQIPSSFRLRPWLSISHQARPARKAP